MHRQPRSPRQLFVPAAKSFLLLAMVVFGILSRCVSAQVGGTESSVGFDGSPLILDTWVQAAELTGGAAGDYFGYSVSVDGKTVVIGAPDPSGNGAAYVFVEPVGG
jgi:hypothetical protein